MESNIKHEWKTEYTYIHKPITFFETVLWNQDKNLKPDYLKEWPLLETAIWN